MAMTRSAAFFMITLAWFDSNFFILPDCVHYFKGYFVQKTPLKLDIWFQRYGQLKGCKNNKKQNILCPLFGYILKSIFPTSDWLCLITPHVETTMLCYTLAKHAKFCEPEIVNFSRRYV